MIEAIPVFTSPTPRVRRVSVDRPWTWLARGWVDLLKRPRESLAFGVLIVVISVALTLGLWIGGMLYLLLPLVAGFAFVAPLLAVGIYEISRRQETGEPITLSAALQAWQRNRAQLALMGLILMLLHLFWIRTATLLFALFFSNMNPTLDQVFSTLFLSPASLPFLFVGTVIGAALAALAFAISAVSIPMLVDRDVSVFTAIATSWVAVRANWQAMTLWAGLIVVFTGLGIATFYVGLAVAMPLVGHATWHAYKDLVE